MTPSSNSPDSNPWYTHSWVMWLRHNGLSLPAWIVVESLRPMTWVAGQLALVVEPVANGLGVDGWQRLINTLEDPAAYNALCAALHSDEETPS